MLLFTHERVVCEQQHKRHTSYVWEDPGDCVSLNVWGEGKQGGRGEAGWLATRFLPAVSPLLHTTGTFSTASDT
jgi:hypothetical protein